MTSGSPLNPGSRAASVESVFIEALDQPAAERVAWLEAQTGLAPEVRAEVAALLDHDTADDDGFLRSPVRRDDPLAALRVAAAEADPGAGSPVVEDGIPESIGPYEIVSLIGAGGMGAVYEAIQPQPRRTVAIKLIRPDVVSASAHRRFSHEAEVLGRLDHPGIARVLDAGIAPVRRAGTTVRQAFIAMERVEGERLDAWARRTSPDRRTIMETIRRVSEALQHAHQRRVVHRDLKPANILVTPDGDPRLLDFGVALSVDAESRITSLRSGAGAAIGTLAYMSPEQVGGDPEAADVRSDVYALGVVAYELLTGRLPHETADRSFLEVARAIREDEPQRPSSVDRALRGDLETIVLTAMAREPGRRYASASEFGADIGRWLNGEPIAARPASTLYHLRCFARRNTGLVAGFGAAVVLLVAGTATSTVFAVRALAAEESALEGLRMAEQEASRAWAVGEFLERTLGAADPFDESASGQDTTVAEMLDRASGWVDERFQSEPVAEVEVRTILGRTEKSLGRYDRAVVHLARAMELLEAAEDPEPSLFATVLAQRGATLERAGRTEEAIEVFERLRRTLETVDADPESARAADRRRTARPVTAEGLARRLSAAWGTLGWFERRVDRPEEARQALETSIRLARVAGSPARTHLAFAYNNLAGTFLDLQDYAAASDAYDTSLGILRRILPPEHPILSVVANNVGRLSMALKQWDRAADRFQATVVDMERSLGAVHPSRAIALNNLAYALHELTRYAEADAAYVESLAITAEIQGPEHREYAGTLRNRAFLLRDAGRFAEAATVWDRVADLFAGYATENPIYPVVYRAYAAEARAADPAAYEREIAAMEATRNRLAGEHGADSTWAQFVVNALVRAAERAGDAEDLARFRALLAPE